MTAKKLQPQVSHARNFHGPDAGLAPELTQALSGVGAKVLAAFVAREHPQIGAVVLAHVDAKTAGETLKLLAPSARPELLARLARLGPVDPMILDDLLEAVEDELAREHAASAHPPEGGGPEGVAALLQTVDRETADAWLAGLSQKHPDLSAKIRELSFRFADLSRLTPKSMQDLVREVQTANWRVALRGAPEPLIASICAAMSPRVAKQLREDLINDAKARQADVETAQRQITDAARQLLDAGRLDLMGGADKYV